MKKNDIIKLALELLENSDVTYFVGNTLGEQAKLQRFLNVARETVRSEWPGQVTINSEQELYVIYCGKGFSYLGFDVALNRAQRYGTWLQMVGVPAAVPTSEHRGNLFVYAMYSKLADAVCDYCRKTRVRCEVDLTDQLKGLEGKTVEVVDKNGEMRKFVVGKSTGQIPIHLECGKGDGGYAVTGAPFRSVVVK